MKVHKIIHYTTLKVILDAVDDDLSSHVHDLEVGQMILVPVGVDGLVHLFVVADAVSEVERGLLWVLALVVRTSSLDIPNVGHDELLFVTFGLDKYDVDTFLVDSVEHPFPALLGAVCRIENTNHSTALEPLHHVCHGSLGRSPSLALAFGIVGVEEVS